MSPTLGEQVRHWPMSSFQHTETHTQLPQFRHCLNWSLTASTAAFIALSLAGEFVARSNPICSAAPLSSASLPPNSEPALRRRLRPRSLLLAMYGDRYPFPHRSQTNSNWNPPSLDRSLMLSVNATICPMARAWHASRMARWASGGSRGDLRRGFVLSDGDLFLGQDQGQLGLDGGLALDVELGEQPAQPTRDPPVGVASSSM